MAETQLNELLLTPLKLGLPSSTVAVERGVKITSEAVKHSCEASLQDGLSPQKIAARSRNPLDTRNKKMWNK